MGEGAREVRDPVPRSSLTDDLTRRVLDIIRAEGLEPGDRLPPVRSLAERFSVAAPTMREALRRLQANGVVEMKHGSGVYVRNGRERIVFVNPNRGTLDPDTILELLEARLLIEPHLAGLAGEQADEIRLAKIERSLKEAERYLDGGNDHMLQLVNMKFHHAIAESAGNSLLSQIVESLIDLYAAEQLAIMMIYDDRYRDHREHLEIMAAIRGGDPKSARESMRRHIQGVKDVIEARLAEGEPDGDGRSS